jgi:hypothetical protein
MAVLFVYGAVAILFFGIVLALAFVYFYFRSPRD